MEPWMMGATLGLGALSSFFGGKDGGKGTVGSSGPSVVHMPQYPWTEPTRRGAAEFVSSNLQRLQEGKYPAYYEAAMPHIKEGMGRSLHQTFYGSPMGGPGVLDQVRSAGAAGGVGPGGMMRQTSKVAQEYANKSKEIDEFLHQMGVGLAERGSYNFSQLAAGMPGGPDAQVLPGQPYNVPPQPNMWDHLGQMAGAAPWLMGGMGGGGKSGGYGQEGIDFPWSGQSVQEWKYNQQFGR